MCLNQKKNIYYILFNRTSLFLFFIHFIKSDHSFTLILTLSRSSLIPLKLHSLNVAAIVKLTPVQYNLLLLLLLLFFHFIKSSLIHSLSFTVISHLKPLKLTLSTSPARPSSTSSARSHSLNSDHRPTKLAADRSPWLGNPWRSPLIEVLACGYWFFHTTDRRFGLFFFSAVDWWCWWWLWVWLWGKRLEIWVFFFFLLWTGGGGGGVDCGCGYGCGCIWWWDILFYCDVYIILLC